jgi:RNA polymerase sigma-70 factor, ECF subfamily
MQDQAPEADDELLLRMHSGDEQAFVSLYRKRQPALYRFAANMTGSRTVAEDITQEVFMTLLRTDCGFDPELGSLSGYLFGIARKLAFRHLERGRANLALDTGPDEPHFVEPSVNGTQLSDLTRKEGIESLRKAIQALPGRYREVVALCDLEEVDYAEAALILECPVGTVRSRLHRARALLLEKLRHGDGRPMGGSLKPARSLL